MKQKVSKLHVPGIEYIIMTMGYVSQVLLSHNNNVSARTIFPHMP